jgi:protein-L-isoaspartate(D-aspartate) O-methyltransferase
MKPTDRAIEEHLNAFISMLNEKFLHYGVSGGLPEQLKEAVRAMPRHRFVHRFAVATDLGCGRVRDFDAHPMDHISLVYSDGVLNHVDVAGALLPSTNSQPSFVLWLLQQLSLQHGHHTLEIGSGSGWLAAVMSRLVGDDGRVTGIEIIPDLAEQSRADLAALGIGNVTILTGDGTQGHAEGAPYDRLMITAATWDLPLAVFDQTAEGGCAIVPVSLKGGGLCAVSLLRKVGAHFIAEQCSPGGFVPLVGPGQDQMHQETALEALPFWAKIRNGPILRRPFRLGGASSGAGRRAGSMWAFHIFLRVTEPGFTMFDNGPQPRRMATASSFGIVDENHQSVAICEPGELICYGHPSAAEKLARAYVVWTALSMPGLNAFGLEIVKAENAPVPSDGIWIDRRGDSALVWRLQAGSEIWRKLIPSPG